MEEVTSWCGDLEHKSNTSSWIVHMNWQRTHAHTKIQKNITDPSMPWRRRGLRARDNTLFTLFGFHCR